MFENARGNFIFRKKVGPLEAFRRKTSISVSHVTNRHAITNGTAKTIQNAKLMSVSARGKILKRYLSAMED